MDELGVGYRSLQLMQKVLIYQGRGSTIQKFFPFWDIKNFLDLYEAFVTLEGEDLEGAA